MDELLKEAFDCFILECEEHIEKATAGLLSLEKAFDAEAVDSVFRSFHTIKGNSRMFELKAAPDLAHAAEGLMARFRARTLEPRRGHIDLLLRGLDAIKALLDEVAATGAEGAGAPDLAAELRAAAAEGQAATEAGPRPASAGEAARAPSPPAPPAARPAPASAPSPQRPPAAPRPPATGGAAAPAEGPVPARPLSILVVEDDFLCRRSLEGMLKPLGAVDVAVDGKEAIEAFARSLAEGVEHPYDLVCIDLMMPGLDGFEGVKGIRDLELAATLRRIESGTAVRELERRDSVILVTTSLDDPSNYIKACYRCGANAYLVKPIGKARLYAELERFGLLGRPSGAGAGGEAGGAPGGGGASSVPSGGAR